MQRRSSQPPSLSIVITEFDFQFSCFCHNAKFSSKAPPAQSPTVEGMQVIKCTPINLTTIIHPYQQLVSSFERTHPHLLDVCNHWNQLWFGGGQGHLSKQPAALAGSRSRVDRIIHTFGHISNQFMSSGRDTTTLKVDKLGRYRQIQIYRQIIEQKTTQRQHNWVRQCYKYLSLPSPTIKVQKTNDQCAFCSVVVIVSDGSSGYFYPFNDSTYCIFLILAFRLPLPLPAVNAVLSIYAYLICYTACFRKSLDLNGIVRHACLSNGIYQEKSFATPFHQPVLMHLSSFSLRQIECFSSMNSIRHLIPLNSRQSCFLTMAYEKNIYML